MHPVMHSLARSHAPSLSRPPYPLFLMYRKEHVHMVVRCYPLGTLEAAAELAVLRLLMSVPVAAAVHSPRW